jgi:hypothetical protein
MATTVSLKPNAVEISGSTSGTTTLQATAVAGTTTLTLPAATDTLVGKATTDTLTNKTLTGAVMNGTLGATTPSTVAATTLTTSSTVTHNGGTANGVAYLNGSKVLTTGTALVFDGTNLGVGAAPSDTVGYGRALDIQSTTGAAIYLRDSDNPTTQYGFIAFDGNASVNNLNIINASSTGPIRLFTNGTEAARIDSSGNLLVGTTSAGARFTVGGTAASAASSTICRIGDADYTTDTVLSVAPGVVNFDAAAVVGGRFHISSGGEVRIAGTTDQGAYNLQVQGTGVWGAGAYVNGSDSRIKEDIAPIATGLSVVEKLNPVTYRYKEDWSKDQSTQIGFIAQELLVALQDTNYVDSVVQQGGEKGYYSVAYQNIIPILTKAIQEQQALITQLQADVAALKGA